MAKYDENGFDSNWIHKDTGTRYDELGFNKNGTIHKDTNTAYDKFGQKGEYYRKNGTCSYFNVVLGKLFLNTSILNFDGSKFVDVKLDYQKISKIRLASYDDKIQYTDDRPKKLNGTPDYRYSGNYSTNKIISYSLIYSTLAQVKGIRVNYSSPRQLTKKEIMNSIEKYNLFLSSLTNTEIKNLYKNLLYTKERCKAMTKEISKLKLKKKEKADIYNQLNIYKDKFTEEQINQFKNLKLEIESIDDKINKEKDLKNEFKDIYEKLKIKLQALEAQNSHNKEEDEINDLFSKLK